MPSVEKFNLSERVEDFFATYRSNPRSTAKSGRQFRVLKTIENHSCRQTPFWSRFDDPGKDTVVRSFGSDPYSGTSWYVQLQGVETEVQPNNGTFSVDTEKRRLTFVTGAYSYIHRDTLGIQSTVASARIL